MSSNPNSSHPTQLSATTLADRIRGGSLEPTAVVEAFLERIEDRNPELNAYVTVTDELARRQARAVRCTVEREREREHNVEREHERELPRTRSGACTEDPSTEPVPAHSSVGPLCGVPVALKDLGDMKAGIRHTFGSALIDDRGFVAPRTTVPVERLEVAGAIILGKTNVPELGHKGTTDNDILGETVSPRDHSLNAGGSSGGSGAAVGAGLAPVALGSDAGGSVRIPAACCGVVGFKPSFGLIPNDSRPNAFGTTTHHTATGPIARTVSDIALLMDVLVGPHPCDPASVPVDLEYRAALRWDPADLRVAYSPDLDVFPVEPAVESTAREATEALRSAGVTVEAVELNHGCTLETLTDAVETTFSTSMLAAVRTLEASLGVELRDSGQIADSLQAMLETGERRTVEDVAETGPIRTAVFDAVQQIFSEYDLLATPTLATAGFDSEIGPAEWDRALTWPFNWTGHPVCSVPAGLTPDGRPVGLQLVGRRYGDDVVIAGSAALESERPWDGLYDW